MTLVRMPSHISRRPAGTAFVLAFCLAAGMARGSQDLGPASALDQIPAPARHALDRGEVVTLESQLAGSAYTNRVAALVDGDPTAILAEIRDYAQLQRIFPELRSLSFDRGTSRDRLSFALKVHPLLPAINFSKAVSWDFLPNGDADVSIALVGSDQRRVQSQDWVMHLRRVSGDKTLLLYETSDHYTGVLGKQRLLDRLHDFTERLASDIRERSAARAGATQVGGQ